MDQGREQDLTFGRHVGYVVLSSVAVLVLGLVQLPILTKALGASLYGVWSLLTVTVSLIAPLAALSFSMAIVRFLAAERDPAKVRDDFVSACCTVLVAGTGLSLFLYALSGFLATSVFRDASAVGYLKLGSVLVLLNAFHSLPLAFFRMQRRIGVHALFFAAHQCLLTAFMIALVLLGFSLRGVIVGNVCAFVLTDLVALVLILRQTGVSRPTFWRLGAYLRWGVPLVPTSVILWVIHASDRYMVSYFLGVAATGIYGLAYIVGNYASFMLMPVQTVLYPNIVKTYAAGRLDETARYLKYSAKYLMMVSIPAAVGLSVLGVPLLRVLATPEFAPGAHVIPFVAAGMVVFNYYQILVNILLASDRTRSIAVLLSGAAVLNIGLNLLLIPRMELVGAAVATLVAHAALGLAALTLTRRQLKFDLCLPFIGKSLLASAAMAACLWLLHPAGLTMLLVSAIGGGTVYFGVLILLGGLGRSELAFFLEFAKRQLWMSHGLPRRDG